MAAAIIYSICATNTTGASQKTVPVIAIVAALISLTVFLLLAFLIHIAVERPVAKLMKNTLNKLADKLQNQLHCRKSAGD